MSQQLAQLIAEMEEEKALALTREQLAAGRDPLLILQDCREGIELVGKRFEQGEYFLPELILGGEILKAISAEVKPHIKAGTDPTKGGAKVLIGTVKGDIHDIGKDIVAFMLDVNGFQVKDLGVDVPAETIVQEIRAFEPDVVALSGFLTLAYDSMRETVEAIKAAGLRDKIKIMVGGGTVDEQVSVYAGADAFGEDAMAGVMLAKQWTGGN